MRRKQLRPRLMIRSSAIHAAGCYTLDPIQRGQRFLEYAGERISKTEANERYAVARHVTYLFSLETGEDVIDGFGTAMFLNHSCEPNCDTTESRGHIYIRAIRDIAVGEELVYEYNLHDSDDDDAGCHCGAPQCRGTMFCEEEVKRQAQLKIERNAQRKAQQECWPEYYPLPPLLCKQKRRLRFGP